MATVEHKDIPDANLHEPKGVSTATTGKVLTASSGVGTWAFQPAVVTAQIEDLTIATYITYVVLPYAVTIDSVQSVIDSAFTTADKVVTLSIGGVNITGGSLTIAYSGSAAGDVDSCTCTALNALPAGTPLKITATGGSGGTGGYHGGAGTGTAANLFIKYTRTA